MSEVILNGANGTNYMTSGIYESYIENQIANQERLAYYLREAGVISEAAASNIIALNEAKFSDNIKAKWNKFLAFIKGIAAKFMESMSNLLLSEKSYLEKYKDIILKKKPREDLEYSYTGDYDEGIDRLIKTECPIFNYEKHAEALRKDGYADIIKIVMAGRDFTYNEAETLPNLFKAYYIAAERGVHKGKFADLNMTNLYNFCYNFKKIEDIVKKDQNHLEQTTSQITAAIQKELRERGENTSDAKTTDKAATEPQSGKSGGSDTATNTNGNGADHNQPTTVSGNNSGQSGKQESGAYGYGGYFNEAEDKVKVGTGLNITNTAATSQMSSYNKNTSQNVTDAEKSANAKAAVDDKNSTEEDINKITNKWISVCRPLITAKYTACEQIARDYMTIIRAHIRSYGGDTKNANDDKSPQQGTNYQKPQPEEQKQESAIEESKVVNEKDIYYNKDKFDSGEINLCFILGHSGSGKSTMARDMKTFNTEVANLDEIIFNWGFSDSEFKDRGNLVYSFFKGPGKKFRYSSIDEYESDKKWHDKDPYIDGYGVSITTEFVKYAMQYAKSHKNTKFIVEGIWLFEFINPSDLDSYAVYIKGTSMLISRIRSSKRDSSTHKGLDRAADFTRRFVATGKYFKMDEKKINKYRSHFSSKIKN